MNRLILPLVAALFSHGVLDAHPIPGREYDRAISVTPTPKSLRIGYQLNIDGNIAFRTMPRLMDDLSGLDGPREIFAAFTPRMGELIADQLFATLDGKELKFEMISDKHRTGGQGYEHHVICSYLFEVKWEPEPDAKHELTFRELNFPENPGEIDLKLITAAPGITLVNASVPDPALNDKPDLERTAADDEARRVITATFTVEGVAPATEVTPPEAELPPVEDEGPRSIWADLKARGLPVLFDSSYGLGLLLLLAAVFGAAHALTPGHGKAMVAAYLVGERGTFLHAVILGVVVTVTHTGAVIAMAAILYLIYPDTVEAQAQQILGFAGGLLIAGLGVWLFLNRVAGKADHVHLFGGHHHHHDGHTHGHSHGHTHGHSHAMPGGWWGLIVLGISGGIVPCWDAVALLGIAITANRLWLGVPLLIAFSVGLAAVLMLLGMAVVYAKKLGGKKFGDSRWFRLLPILSATLLIVIGVWLCRDSLKIEAGSEKPSVVGSGPVEDA